ncbi:hypothetical protein HDR58_04720 [bacterium]|nr:hypothetical protein [bacterium]
MTKKFILILISLVLTIAYFDMLDSFKHLDKIVSNMIKLDTDVKMEIYSTNQNLSNDFKTQK